MFIENPKKLILLFIGLSLVPFGTIFQNLIEAPAKGFSYTLALTAGSFAGFVGAVLMLWQFALGIRFISSKLSQDIIWFNNLHKNLGIWGTLLIFTHPLLKAYTYYGSIKYAIIPNFSDPTFLQVGFGRFALSLLVIIFLTSAIFRSKIKYRIWKLIHYLAYASMFFVFLHAPAIGTYINTYPLLDIYWTVLTTIFYVIVAMRIATFMGFGSKKYFIVSKQQHDDIFIYKVKPIQKHISPKVGQFCYIKVKKFGEEHPFTVMKYNSKSKDLTFGIKAQGKFTKRLSELKSGQQMLVDGPYGVFTIEGHNNEPKVILAGGIGITPFIQLVTKYGNEQTYMLNANRNIDLAIYRETLKKKLGNRYYDVIDEQDIEGENIIKGKVNKQIVKDIIPDDILMNANIFICGSKGFFKACKEILLDLNVDTQRIFYEEFSL